MRIWTIASNTFREAVRNRAFLGLMLGAAGFMLFGLALSELTIPDQAGRVVLDYGQFGMPLLGVVIAVVVGVILLHKELDKKTIYTILAKPVRRHEFVLGKYLGMEMLLFVEILILALVWAGMLVLRGTTPGMIEVKATMLCFLEVSLIAASAVAFSSFSTPVLSGIFATGVFLIGRTVFVVEEMLAARIGLFVSYPSLRPIGRAVLVVFPDLKVFNVSDEILLRLDVPFSYVASCAAYCFWFVAAFLALAVFAFEKRDLT